MKHKLLSLMLVALVLAGCGVDLSWLQSGEIQMTEAGWMQAALCLTGILMIVAVPAAGIALLAALMDE